MQGFLVIVPIDKAPNTELKEKIRKTLASCKSAIDDYYKKKNFLQFLEAFISQIVTALTSVEGSKEYKEKADRVTELESELQLSANTIKK